MPLTAPPNYKIQFEPLKRLVANHEAQVLLRLLEKRFGPTSESERSRVEAATLEEFDGFFDRLLDAASVDEVLRGV